MIKKNTSKRQWFVSITAILIITIGTIVLVAFAQGYNYDALHNQINKTGLVLLDSNPNGAQVFINNKYMNRKTPYRYSGAPAGNIDIKLLKDNYRKWEKKASVVPGEVTFANYALLIPDILNQEPIDSSINFYSIIQTQDNETTIGLSKTPLSLYSISSNGQIKQIYLPKQTSDPTKQVIDIENIRLSNDGQKVLFNQKLADNSIQVIVLEIANSKLNNLSEEFGFNFVDLRFNPKDSSEIFWLESKTLRKILLNEKRITSNLIENIDHLYVEKDRLLVISNNSTPEQNSILYSYDLSGNNKIELLTLKSDPKGYDILFIRSRYAEYISIIYKSTERTELIKNPYQLKNELSHPIDIGFGVSNQTINPNSRFLVYNQNNTLRLIDLEFGQDMNYGASLEGLQKWSWYDDYRLVVMQNNVVVMLDYDGQNIQLLAPINDIATFGIVLNEKSIMPLNNKGNLYKLSLVKK